MSAHSYKSQITCGAFVYFGGPGPQQPRRLHPCPCLLTTLLPNSLDLAAPVFKTGILHDISHEGVNATGARVPPIFQFLGHQYFYRPPIFLDVVLFTPASQPISYKPSSDVVDDSPSLWRLIPTVRRIGAVILSREHRPHRQLQSLLMGDQSPPSSPQLHPSPPLHHRLLTPAHTQMARYQAFRASQSFPAQ